jgi:hypothetical protein
MRRFNLFQYAVILQPKFKDDEIVEEGDVILKPQYILAESEREVTIIAARKIPEAYMDRLDRVEVAVRPF